MLRDSLRGITEDWGEQVETQRVTEASAAFAVTETGERADRVVIVAEVYPISTHDQAHTIILSILMSGLVQCESIHFSLGYLSPVEFEASLDSVPV